MSLVDKEILALIKRLSCNISLLVELMNGAIEEDHEEERIHEGIIILIHRTPSLDNLQDIFITIFELLCHLLKSLPNTGVGCYIFNTKEKNGVKEIFKLQDINELMFQILGTLIKSKSDLELQDSIQYSNAYQWEKLFPLLHNNVEEEFGGQLLNVLNQSLHDFNDHVGTIAFTNKKVFLITDCYKPFNGDANTKIALQNMLKRLMSDRIRLYPLLMENTIDLNTSPQEFNDLFEISLEDEIPNYKHLVFNTIKMEDIQEKLIQTVELRRGAFNCVLTFGELNISVKGINIFRETKLNPLRFYQEEDFKYPVKSESIYYSDGEFLEKNDIVKTAEVYREAYLPVYDKFDNIRTFETKLVVKGTLPDTKFSPYIINGAKIIIPDDYGEFTNSRTHFTAFYRSLVKYKKIAICWGSLRRNAVPSLYILLPTGSSGDYPKALAIMQLPHGDELRRAPKFLKDYEMGESDTSRLSGLVDSMVLDNMEVFSNNVLEAKLNVLVSHASESRDISKEDWVLKEDKMKLIIDQQRQLREKNDCKLVNSVISSYNAISNSVVSNEREEHVDKKPKREPLTDSNVKLIIKLDMLGQYTVAELKSYLKMKDVVIPAGSRKDALLHLIIDFVE